MAKNTTSQTNTQAGQLDGGRLLAELAIKDPRHGQLIQNIIDGVNQGFKNAGVSAIGDNSPPKSPDTVSVKVAGEMLHVSINHSGPLQRNVRYFSEISNNPNFSQPLVIDHGTSRTSHPIPLPTFADDGTTRHQYYVRSYAQNPGGPPSAPTVVGGLGSPTAFQMAGSTAMTPLPSQGSGTAPNNGQSAGQGLGRFQTSNAVSKPGPPSSGVGQAGVSWTVNGV